MKYVVLDIGEESWNFERPGPMMPIRTYGTFTSGGGEKIYYVIDSQWCFWLGMKIRGEILLVYFAIDVALDVIYYSNLLAWAYISNKMPKEVYQIAVKLKSG